MMFDINLKSMHQVCFVNNHIMPIFFITVPKAMLILIIWY